MKYTGPGPDDCIVAYGNPGGHKHIGGDPDAISNRYGLVREFEAWIVIIMRCCAQKALLRNGRMLADLYRRDGIKPGIVTDG